MRPTTPSYGPLLLMAPHIERARIGPAGIPPSRAHPLDIAAQTALLADLAAGGVYIGLVRGGWLADHGITELAPPITGDTRVCRHHPQAAWPASQRVTSGAVFQIAEQVRAPYPLPSQSAYRCKSALGERGSRRWLERSLTRLKIGGSANADVIPVNGRLTSQPARIARWSRTPAASKL